MKRDGSSVELVMVTTVGSGERMSTGTMRSVEVLEQHATAALRAYNLVFARVQEHARAAPDESQAQRHAYLAAVEDELKETESLFLVDAAGQVTAHSRFYPVPTNTIADRDYFRDLAPPRLGGREPGGEVAEAARGPGQGAPIAFAPFSDLVGREIGAGLRYRGFELRMVDACGYQTDVAQKRPCARASREAGYPLGPLSVLVCLSAHLELASSCGDRRTGSPPLQRGSRRQPCEMIRVWPVIVDPEAGGIGVVPPRQ